MKPAVKSLIGDIVIAAVIVAGINIVVKPTIVNGESMDDTLHDGNYLIVNKMSYLRSSPERGDIVVLDSHDSEEKLFIKRVIGVAGDEVKTDGKATYVNGEKVSEPYLKEDTEGMDEAKTWTVPEGCVFVMGDNRDNSLDSRDPSLGFVSEEDIIGKAAVRLYPFDQIGTVR